MRRLMLLVAAVLALVTVQLGDSATDPGLLVYTSMRSPGRDGVSAGEFANLFTLRADGRGVRRLTTVREGEADPEWSPNGRRIAFSRGIETDCHGGYCDSVQASEIWVVDATGRNARPVTRQARPIPFPEAFRDLSPTWSPDGRQIAFVHQFYGPSSEDGIYIVGANGRGSRLVLARSGMQSLDWSPDGRTLAFVANEKVELLDLHDEKVRHVGPGYQASWSPSGHSLAVTRRSGIFVVPVHGGASHRIVPTVETPRARANDLVYCLGVSWSPDGRQLVFSATQHGRGFDIFIVNVDGSGLKRITGNPFSDVAPDWRP